MIHCGFVGILGLPNAGKSTFLNKVLGEKVAIISSKPQTTRQAFTGLITEKDYQLIFLDAPGFVEPKAGLFQFLNDEFHKVIEKSEHLLVLVSHEQKDTEIFKKFIKEIKGSQKPVSYLFTKADLPETDFVKSFKESLQGEILKTTDTIKEKNRELLDEFLEKLSRSLPQEHHPLYDPDMISLDRTRDIVAEFIREQCFLRLDKEIPYGLGVIIKSFKKEKGLQHIQANILVEKENHKGILIGKGGAQLKKIGQDSRKKIEELLGEKVFLGLHVAYKKNWMKNPSIMKEVGYVHGRE
jgi:GTP-binding protein Era